MRAKISAITVATGAWLKREEWEREEEEEERDTAWRSTAAIAFSIFLPTPQRGRPPALQRRYLLLSLTVSLSLSFCFTATAASFFTVASAAVCPDSCALHL